MQPPRGVHNHHIGMASLGCRNGVKYDRGRIRPWFLLDHFNSVALGPYFQLLDCRRAESVRGAQNHASTLLPQAIRQFPDAGGLSRAVYSDNKNNAATASIRRNCEVAVGGCGAVWRSKNSHNVRLDFVFQLRAVGKRVTLDFFLYRIQYFASGFDSEVRG